jgi:hypothetical protein
MTESIQIALLFLQTIIHLGSAFHTIQSYSARITSPTLNHDGTGSAPGIEHESWTVNESD